MIERYSKEQFENALPRHKETGEALWMEAGIVDAEYTYRLPIREGVEIMVRSSVKPTGIAADTGKDSIRAWLVSSDLSPLGSKILSYTTRMPGWELRMKAVLQELWRRGQNIMDCPKCNNPMGVFQVKKEGKNKGRLFMKCWDHGFFTWMDENGVPERTWKASERKKMEAASEDVIIAMLRECTLVKERVELLRETLAEDEDVALFGMHFLYDHQTFSEQATGTTVEKNRVGFSGVDAELLTSFTEQHIKSETLSPKQMKYVFKKLPKYARQIERILRAKL